MELILALTSQTKPEMKRISKIPWIEILLAILGFAFLYLISYLTTL